MRIVTALAILVLLAGAAYADPSSIEPKPWQNQFGPPRDTYPEAEPNDTCPGQAFVLGDIVSPAFLAPGEQDWYSFSANAGDVLTIGTDAYQGSSVDTYIELYFECGGTMLAYDDDSGPGLFSLIATYNVPQTGTYNVKVRGYSGSSTGNYIFFAFMQQPPPPNDLCSGAIVIERCTQASLTGDLAPYTNNYDPGSGGCADGYAEAGKDETYKVDLLAGDILDMTYTQLSADGAFYVVTDCANVPGTCVAGADATVTGQPEVISYTATADGTYYIILDCYGTNTGGAWTWTYTVTCPGPPEGACCIDTVCTITTEAGCQGTWQGAGTDCDPNPCVPVPVEESSWGHIKANYR